MKRPFVILSGLGIALLGGLVSSHRQRGGDLPSSVSVQAVTRTPAPGPLPHLADVPPLEVAGAKEAPVLAKLPALVSEEQAFMEDLRVLAEMDPELAIERARDGAARFELGADASERRAILIHALARVGRASEARGEAERMVNECPDDAWVSEIERFTGAHRHRNIRLAANGRLEYE